MTDGLKDHDNVTKSATPASKCANRATSYSYDVLNRVTAVTDPLSRATSHTYDANGNVTQVEDGNGVADHEGYDKAGRLTRIDLNDNGTLDIQYGYDAVSWRRSPTGSATPPTPTTMLAVWPGSLIPTRWTARSPTTVLIA
jgi:YD repeat-containing protein